MDAGGAHGDELKAIHLLVEAEAATGERLRFFQSMVLYARNIQDAEALAAELLHHQGARLVAVDPEETREVDPSTVKFGGARPNEWVVGISGRVWVKPGFFGRWAARLRNLWGGEPSGGDRVRARHHSSVKEPIHQVADAVELAVRA